jgi:hypothetical protein
LELSEALKVELSIARSSAAHCIDPTFRVHQ